MAGTKVLMRMREDGDLELLDELAATGTMTAETDETAMMAVTALALGVGFAVARDKVNGKEQLKKRPRRRKDKRPGSTDGDATEMMNVDEPIAHDAGGMVLSDGGSTDKQSLHESPKSVRLWVSGALTSLMLICFALSGWLWMQTPRQNQKVAVAAELAPHRTVRENETKNIEDVRLGQRVVGRNPLREQTQLPSDIRPETHRAIRLEMIQHEALYELAFLRSLTWLDEQQAEVGGTIHLVMTEMGLDGPARVLSIDPCPEIEPNDGTGGNVVTGTMAHPGANIVYLDITGLDEPLGVTATHPIWSETRQDFVVAGHLEIGENFRTFTGQSATLTKIHPHRGPPEMVFNLEVDGQHVYHVAASGLLVHNDCPIIIGENMDRVQAYAAANGGHAYRPWKNEPFDKALGLARNERWLADQMRAGRKIIDIGPDFARRTATGNASDFYQLERRLLQDADYGNYQKVFERLGQTGGVPGLD